METEQYDLPSYWASYLVNGDASGLEDGEQLEIDLWMERIQPGNCVDVSESWFARSNDANNMGGDVATYTFMK